VTVLTETNNSLWWKRFVEHVVLNLRVKAEGVIDGHEGCDAVIRMRLTECKRKLMPETE